MIRSSRNWFDDTELLSGGFERSSAGNYPDNSLHGSNLKSCDQAFVDFWKYIRKNVTTKSYLGVLSQDPWAEVFWLSKTQAPFFIVELNEYKRKCSHTFVWDSSSWDSSSKFCIFLDFSYINNVYHHLFPKEAVPASRFRRQFGGNQSRINTQKSSSDFFEFKSRMPPGSRHSSSPVQLNPEH